MAPRWRHERYRAPSPACHAPSLACLHPNLPPQAGEGVFSMNATGTLIALGTIVRREVVRILRIWSQTLLPPAITMTLYFIIFCQLVGSRIGTIAQGADGAPISYIEYIPP